MTIAADELDLDAIRAARVFWTTGTGLSAPSRAARDARGAASARDDAASAITVHDLDHRPMFWPDEPRGDAAARARRCAHATVAVGNRDEVAVAVGTRDPHEASAALLELGVRDRDRQAGAGRRARPHAPRRWSRSRRCRSTSSTASAPATRSAARSCTALLEGWDVERTIRLANAAGAFVAGRLACADDMPTLDDLER